MGTLVARWTLERVSSRQPSTQSSGTVTTSLVVMVVIVVGLWAVELVDQASGNALDAYGIRPRTDEGLFSVFTAPLLHGSWAHLASNSLPFLILGFLVLLDGWKAWLVATLTSVISSGLLVWLVAPAGSITLGASGVVFGWLTYLLLRGLFSANLGQLVLAAVLFVLYGGLLWGVLPGAVGISWQGHLGGALGGGVAAWLLRRR